MMPETCCVNLLWINIYTCVICWFFLLLASSCLFVYRPHGTTRFPLDGLLMKFEIWRFFENLFRIFSLEYDSVDTCTWKHKRPLGTARGSQWRAQWTSVGGTVTRPSLVESNRVWLDKMQRSSPSASGDMIRSDSCKTGCPALALCYCVFVDRTRCDLNELGQTVQEDTSVQMLAGLD